MTTVATWRGRRDESGFTVVEMAIAVALAAIVFSSITGALMSQTNVERDISTFTVNQEDIRQTLIAIGQDLRSAEPLTEVWNPLEMQYRVDLKVYESVTSTQAMRVRWRLDTINNELVREIVDDYENVVGTTHRMAGVMNATLSAPIFRYYRADNVEYDLLAVGTTPGTVAQCTVRVRIDLRAMPHGGRSPVQLVSDVQLRNRLPGDPVCAG